MRLTAELVGSAPVRINPLTDRELELRGLKIAVIENLGVTRDGFDCFDLSDNEIARLENFPVLRRLSMLLLSNNLIHRVSAHLGAVLPNLTALVLTANRIASLAEVEVLSSLKQLTLLSLLHNPVARKPNYRLFVIHRFPALRLLDFQKVTRKERLAAAKFFASKAGKAFLKDVEAQVAAVHPELAAGAAAAAAGVKGAAAPPPPPSAAVAGAGASSASASDASAGSSSGGGAAGLAALTPVQMAAVQAAIAAARTPAEIDALEKHLREGTMPPAALAYLPGGAAAAAAIGAAPIAVV